MPLNIRNEANNQLAEKLAARRHVIKTDAVRMALENELRHLNEAVPLRERVRFCRTGSCAGHRPVWRRTRHSTTRSAATPDVVDASWLVAILRTDIHWAAHRLRTSADARDFILSGFFSIRRKDRRAAQAATRHLSIVPDWSHDHELSHPRSSGRAVC
jgi:hypothetical protein